LLRVEEASQFKNEDSAPGGKGASVSRIGLRSTGLTVFGARVISAFTGLLFTFMVARWLVPSQFGLWEVIMDLVVFSSYPIAVVAYWATRDVARGRMLGRTALAAGGVLSGLGLALYFFFTFVTYSSISASLLPFLLGSILVPLSYWSSAVNSIVSGYRPSVFGYSLVASELAKLAATYEGLYVFHLGIEGVLLGLMTAYFVQSAISTAFVREASTERVDLGAARRWMSLFWVPALSQLPLAVLAADTYLASLGFGTTIVGYYQIAFIVASVVGYSTSLSASLYPLLLRGGGQRLTSITMEFTLLFSLPLAAGGVVLAQPLLFLFGKSYTDASLGLSILAVVFLFQPVSFIIDQTLMGTETVDEEASVGFGKMLRSNLAFVPLVNLTQATAYIVAMLLALWYAFSRSLPTPYAVALWASVQLLTSVLFLAVKALRARRSAKLMPGRESLYHLAAALGMGAVVYLLSLVVLDRTAGTLVYAGELLFTIGVGAGVYFGLVYLVDAKFRQLARTFLK
jgi:O-antigen/teichoic acid export membrane protein